MFEKYLHDGLNLNRFAVVAVWPQPKETKYAVLLMRSRDKGDPAPWCVQYRGNGHYFETVQDAFGYCTKRGFRLEMPT